MFVMLLVVAAGEVASILLTVKLFELPLESCPRLLVEKSNLNPFVPNDPVNSFGSQMPSSFVSPNSVGANAWPSIKCMSAS